MMIMPALLLQKPSKKSKAKDHKDALERRLQLWDEGKISELIRECQTIQNHLSSNKNGKQSIKEISKKFIDRMSKGNINGAIKLLSDNMENGIIPLNEETLSKLREKHPKSKIADKDVLLTDIPIEVHPIRFEEIDAEMIRNAATKTKGGSGPSGLDGEGWRRLLYRSSLVKNLQIYVQQSLNSPRLFARNHILK